MASEYDYQLWIYKCQKIIHQAQIKKKIRRKRIICALLCNEMVIQICKRKYTPKKFWIHPLFKLRREHGFFEAVFPTLSSYSEKIENYIRMTAVQFEQLLYLVGPKISKQKVIREPISAPARLAMTLRFLATGDCMSSISYQYLHDEDDIYIPPNLVDQEGPNGIIPGSWRHEAHNSALKDRPVHGNNCSSRSAIAIREDFCEYFNAEGAVPWQYGRN
ncbi:Protein of unknown function [Cotesia congregata]|uniref:Uncharacterized protein n=1 Tax=Cotesia congregata TaxID=51543 RepID=A0A8J2H6W0_COTCN|nr:Protein of unknown function [Cotesia congregata]